MPKISVVVPVFQVELYIKNMISSICQQTFKDFEVILVDDGSRDNSISVAENILKKSSIVYRVIRQKNFGQSAARNKGIEEASGEWVICLDADDCISPYMLEKLELETRKQNVDVVFCNYASVSEKELMIFNKFAGTVEVLSKQELALRFLTRQLIIIVPTLLIKRTFILENSIYYPPECRWSEDQYYIWKLIGNLDDIVYINEPLYHYLTRPKSVMTSSNVENILSGYNYFCQLETSLNESQIDLGFDPSLILARWILGTAHSSAKILNYEKFRGLLKKMDYSGLLNELGEFSDYKTKLAGLILFRSKLVFYTLARWR